MDLKASNIMVRVITQKTKSMLIEMIKEYGLSMPSITALGGVISELEVLNTGDVSLSIPKKGWWNSWNSLCDVHTAYFFDICKDLIPAVAGSDEAKAKVLEGLRMDAFRKDTREEYVKYLYSVHMNLPQLPDGKKDGEGGKNQKGDQKSEKQDNQKKDKGDNKGDDNQNHQKQAPVKKTPEPQYGEKVLSNRGIDSLERTRVHIDQGSLEDAYLSEENNPGDISGVLILRSPLNKRKG